MLSHFFELRRRILLLFCVFGIFFLIFFLFAPELFRLFIAPLSYVLPKKNAFIATNITTGLTASVQLATDTAMLATTPFVLWHVWRFVSPGLYQQEKRCFFQMMMLSVLLFATGLLCGFYLLIPCLFSFLIQTVPSTVQLMPDMAYTIDFITRMLLISGFSFQIPLLCVLLVRIGLIQVVTLKQIRPYVIVLAFIVGMLLTPPDVVSQVMLALPLCVLYEMGVAFSGMKRKNVLQ